MTVSVLIPSCNPGEHLVAAVRSAKAQPETGEILIADAGSTDGSSELVADMSGVTIIPMGPIGQVAARNELARLATGSWVQWLDADDYLLPGKLAAQLAVATDDVDAVYCDVRVLRPEGQLVRSLAALDPLTAASLGAAIAVHAYLTRADVVRAVPFDSEFEHGGCVSKWALDLTVAGARFAHVPIIGCAYREAWSDQQTTADTAARVAGFERFRQAVTHAGVIPRVTVPSTETLELS